MNQAGGENKQDKLLPKDAVLIPWDATLVFRGEIFDVYQWPQEMYDGSLEVFEMLRRPDTVQIFAIDDDGSVVTVSEEQPYGKKRPVSLPKGRVDKNDASILDAAKRELAEETGLAFDRWQLVDVIQPENKIEWFVYTFVAWRKSGETAPHHDNGEKITVTRTEFNDAKKRFKLKIASKFDTAYSLLDSLDRLK